MTEARRCETWSRGRSTTLPVSRLLILGSWFLATGCASIFHGASQRIEVFSDPPSATATAGDKRITTPGTIVLPRKAESVEVRIEKEGYTPKTVRLARRVSGAVWWNVGWIAAGVALGLGAAQASLLSGSSGNSGDGFVLGGIGVGGLGFLIDFKSGAAYRLEPATLVVKLEREPQPSP